MLISDQAQEMAPRIINNGVSAAVALREAGLGDDQITQVLCDAVFQEAAGVDTEAHLNVMKHLAAAALVQLAKQWKDLNDLHERLSELLVLAAAKGLIPHE